MLLITNLFTIYIHFSHTLAGVIITSLRKLTFQSCEKDFPTVHDECDSDSYCKGGGFCVIHSV